MDYLISWKVPGDRKKSLEAGFRPDLYRRHVSKSLFADPYCHFLTAGRPQGPWIIDLVTDASTDKADLKSVAVHIHAYYSAELEFILNRIERQGTQPLVYVTAFSGVRDEIAQVLDKFPNLRISEIWLNENIGRDLGPFFKHLPESFFRHDVIFHLHTKRSEGAAWSRAWFEALVEQLVGTESRPMLPRIVNHLRSSPRTGIVMAADLRILGWGLNFWRSRRLGKGIIPLPAFWETFVFPIGSMFAAKPEALNTFLELASRINMPREPLSRDGTDLHALERLVCLAAQADGYELGFAVLEDRG
jgi:lipopolysaccharide biosynthesis protein